MPDYELKPRSWTRMMQYAIMDMDGVEIESSIRGASRGSAVFYMISFVFIIFYFVGFIGEIVVNGRSR